MAFFEERAENNKNVLVLAILNPSSQKTTQYKQQLDQLRLGRADLERRETLYTVPHTRKKI